MQTLEDDLSKILENYAEEIEKDVNKELEKSSDKLVDELTKNTPVRTGTTKKGWTKREEGKGYRIYNTNYQPLHLLEYGTSTMAPQPFIRKATNKVGQELYDNIKKDLKE